MKGGSNKNKYHFDKKNGHFKNDCAKYKKWLENKDNLILVCYEPYYIETLDNVIWWIDSAIIIYIANNVYGFLNLKNQ